MRQRLRIIWFSMAAVWLTLSVCGLSVLARYQQTPGPSNAIAVDWPAASKLQRDRTRFTLVLLLHPRCSCSRATVTELSNLMARCDGRMAAVALFLKPSEMPAGWERDALWRSASAIEGVTTVTDTDGVEAKGFGAETSGQAVLFDPAGRVVFRGGITAGRGHLGDSAGQESIAALVTGSGPASVSTPVFGCPLFDPVPTADSTSCSATGSKESFK